MRGKKRARRAWPRIRASGLKEETPRSGLFLGLLLAVDAVGSPGKGLEPFPADLPAAQLAETEIVLVQSPEGIVDQHQLVALRIGKTQEKFLGVGTLGLVDDVLGNVGLDLFALVDELAELDG